MIAKPTEILMHELNSRKKINAKYSLRAFARDLKVSPGFLSEVLNNEKNLSVENALKFSKILGLSSHESHRLVNLVRYHSAHGEKEKSYIRQELRKNSLQFKQFDKLKSDQFTAISDWYHFAILELIDVKDFSSNPAWIAKRLNITVTEATSAIDRLVRIGLIQTDSNNQLVKTKNNGVKDFPSEAVRNFHKQHLKSIHNRIDKIPFEKRHISGTTIAINPKKLAEAAELITSFRSQMCALLEEGDKESVYQLAIQLFPLDTQEPHE